MFVEKQSQGYIDYYERLLRAVCSLSNLFSESPEPYLASRAAENLFCKAFEAENLSRSDVSADASKNKIGLGIKTFIEGNGHTMQKVAEFNRDHMLFSSLDTEQKIKKIAEIRNERIETTKRIFDLDNLIYHCITRQVGKIFVYETEFPLIKIDKIKNIKIATRGSSIQFSDSINDYSFNISKSTLYKRFITDKVILNLPVRILADPFSKLEKIISEAGLIFMPIKSQPHIFLPLYSMQSGIKNVPKKSGLNQWNAAGRPRNPNEIYIPIPAWIHHKFKGFFPSRDKIFELILPDRSVISSSVCQDDSKALMSNPNADLGKWLLRDVLNLKERELLTYEKLQTIGLDTVVIYKIDSEHYDIDFTYIGSYEKFEIENWKDNGVGIDMMQDQDEE
jgi:hypothetical protein